MSTLHTPWQCHRLKTIQACRRYTRPGSVTVSRPYRHVDVTHALAVSPSQDHTGMPTLHTPWQCHRLKTIQACRRYTRPGSATVSRPCRRYTRHYISKDSNDFARGGELIPMHCLTAHCCTMGRSRGCYPPPPYFLQ